MFGFESKAKIDVYTELLHKIRKGKYHKNEICVDQPLTATQIIELINVIQQTPKLRNSLTKLDLSCNTNDPNQTTAEEPLIIANFPQLATLKLRKRNFKHLELRNLPALFWVDANQNHLEKLVAFNTPRLSNLLLGSNRFTKFTLSEYPELELLDLESNSLTSFDATLSFKLQTLNVDANPLQTLIIAGAPLTQKLTFNSSTLDSVSKKLLEPYKLAFPRRVTDTNAAPQAAEEMELKLNDAELNTYLSQLLNNFKQNNATNHSTHIANFFQKLYLYNEANKLPALPLDLMFEICGKEFKKLATTHFTIATIDLELMLNDPQKQLVNKFIANQCELLKSTAIKKLMLNALTPGKKLHTIIQDKQTKLSTIPINTNQAIIVAPQKSLTPRFTAYKMARNVANTVTRALPSFITSKQRNKVGSFKAVS